MSGQVTLVYGDELMKHHLSDTHPLQPIRVKLTMELISSTGLIEHCHLVPPRSATDEELGLVHSPEYIDLVKQAPDEVTISAVRLDSGDLGALARDTRRMLDAAGLQQVGIFASSGLDEWEIAKLLDAGAPIDGFGVGTGMGVSDDAPALDIAYKLSEYPQRRAAIRAKTSVTAARPAELDG